jgi:hypothetical protein
VLPRRLQPIDLVGDILPSLDQGSVKRSGGSAGSRNPGPLSAKLLR